MTTAKLAEALRKELGYLLDREWQKVLRPVLLKRIGLYLAEIKAHAAEAAHSEAQAEPVEAIGCLSIRRFRGCDSMVNHDFDYFGSLPDGDYRLYTHPPAQPPDARDAALLQWAVGRWNAEVANRPLANVHRRSLDDAWRQVVRHAGGDDVVILGPRHDDLVVAAREASDG